MLKEKDKNIIEQWYLKEKNIYQISDEFNTTKESSYNLLCGARDRLENILRTQRHLLPESCKDIIEYLIV